MRTDGTDDSRPLFCMVVRERPLSLRASLAKGYRERLAEAAANRVTKQPLYSEGELTLQVVWFHRERVVQDIDNVLKHVLDALKEIVYHDDAQVIGCSAIRIDLRKAIEVQLRPRNVDQDVLSALIQSIDDRENMHTVFVAVRRRILEFVELGFPEEI